MQHDRTERCAAHARIGDSDHVFHTTLSELLWNRQIASFGHAFRRVRAGVLQDEHILRIHVEIRVVDACGKIGQRCEDHRPTLVLE